MFITKIVLFFFCCLLFFVKQAKAQFININDYENKAQAYAILSAQYSKEAYLLARNNYFSTSNLAVKQNCDTGIVYAQIAMEYADSAILVANDTSYTAKENMLYAKDYQQKAIKKFYQSQSNADEQVVLKSMYLMGNAITDAYKASILFDWKNKKDTTYNKKDGAMYHKAMNNGIDGKNTKDSSRDATRLESDEYSYMTVKEMYGKRLIEIEDEIATLEEEAKKSSGSKLKNINSAIAQLKKEYAEVLEKMKNSEDKLISVKNSLSKEMVKIVDKDIFTTNKKDFYNEKVPIPVNQELPKGLVYKVQIGFFKGKKIKHFNGIFPVTSEKIDNIYYRYVAGNFSTYEDAKDARIAIADKGYTDSFVVAYINGKKVSINEALKEEEKNK